MNPIAEHRRSRTYEQRRRTQNDALGRCINHPLTSRAKPHGPRVGSHVRCQECIDVYTRSK